MNNPRLGILLTVVAVLIFGIQDAIAKILVQDYPVAQIVMTRFWAFAVFALYLAWRQGGIGKALRAKRPGLQILRGLLLSADILLFAAAVKTVPLGELHAIILVFPLLVTLFSIPLLGEKVGVFRWAAVAAGFVGTLVILRPGGVPLDQGALFGLGAAVAFSLYLVFTRMTAHEDSSATAMLYVAGVGLVISSIWGALVWTPMTPAAWGLVAVVWFTSTAGHYLVMRSLHYAPASLVQPFNYLMLPWAIVLSFAIFGHVIDPFALIGGAIVVGAGLVVMWRERVKRPPEVPMIHAAVTDEK